MRVILNEPGIETTNVNMRSAQPVRAPLVGDRLLCVTSLGTSLEVAAFGRRSQGSDQLSTRIKKVVQMPYGIDPK